jgi:putative component of membrane protein insertase Oxa1/YidC/SpoIIIJ protein YidD
VSPRNKWLGIGLVIFLCLPAPALGQQDTPKTHSIIIGFYQDHLSGADGSRCPMFPSCSQYAAEAVQKHGPIMGWVMTFDRVMRCGRSEVRLAPGISVNGQTRVHDPVSANDFWWFNARGDRP